jgi:broad specificity phosphatase PhoE
MTATWRLAFIGLAGALLVPSAADAQRLVLLVRHAERADGGAPPAGMMAPADPELSDAGKSRAARLAAMLADAGITAVVATEFRRTQETARPLAEKLRLAVATVPQADSAGLLNRLKTRHAGDVVLVVGHSNTVPAIITALGGPKITIADTDYDSLFVLVPATGALTRIRY